MENNNQIIKASQENLDELTGLFDLYRQFYFQKSDIAKAKNFLLKRMLKNESVIFLIKDTAAGLFAGFTQLYPAFSSVHMKRIWILNDLFVKSEFRRQGKAEALIRHAAKFAAETGSMGLILETQKDNTEAQKLYDKTGFKIDSDHYYYYLSV